MMYSLYRAWLLRESVTGCTSPDVLITVGTGRQSHQFAGHRTLLSAQSGYLKSLITSSDSNQIVIPNISPDVFAPLLTFIYTGYLDLNADNIYAVLLATHLLHMPRALDLCRSYLIQHQQPVQCPVSDTPSSLIKPIPSRKMFPPFILPPPSVYWPPLPPPPATMPSFASVFSQISVPNPEIEQTEVLTPSLAIPSTSTDRRVSPSPSSLSPCLSQVSDSSDHVTVTISPRTKSRKKSPLSEKNGKVIFDVACCDGPVRFHRVLNQNYGNDSETDKNSAKVPPLPRILQEEHHKIDQPALNDTEKPIQISGEPSQQNNDATMFTCNYCNHTFKSHYCYLKHARRHLNPVHVPTGTKSTKPNKTNKSASREHKREVRLLDMNVQYYPCKTCGSKFPSYYFVHKHRKQCHPEEEVNLRAPSSSSSSSCTGTVSGVPQPEGKQA